MSVRPDLNEIAVRVLRVPTLDERHSDGLDFHDLSVWSIRQALTEAYEKGRTDGQLAKFTWTARLLPLGIMLMGMLMGAALIFARMLWLGLTFAPCK